MTAETTQATTADRRPRPLRNALILAAIAFLAGLVAMGWAMNRLSQPGGWLDRGEPQQAADPSTQASGVLSPQSGAGSPAQAVPVYPAVPPITLDSRVADLETRLSNIDVRAQAASGNAARAEGLLIAFAARRALDRGMQLGYIEAQLRERFGTAQPHAVAVIINASRMPVTLEDLRMALDDAAPELVGGGPDESWWDAIRRELSGMIVVRKEGAPSPAPAERLARAKRRLEGGRVDAALAEVARMPGREKAQAWMAAAKRYNEARQALDTIETAAILEPRELPDKPAAPAKPSADTRSDAVPVAPAPAAAPATPTA